MWKHPLLLPVAGFRQHCFKMLAACWSTVLGGPWAWLVGADAIIWQELTDSNWMNTDRSSCSTSTGLVQVPPVAETRLEGTRVAPSSWQSPSLRGPCRGSPTWHLPQYSFHRTLKRHFKRALCSTQVNNFRFEFGALLILLWIVFCKLFPFVSCLKHNLDPRKPGYKYSEINNLRIPCVTFELNILKKRWAVIRFN